MPALWRLTLRDLSDAAHGAQWRERRALEQLAWQTSYLLRAWVSNAPNPQELLGESPRDAEAALDALTGAKPSAAEQLDEAYRRQAAQKAGVNGR